jgi:hypothetical protein
MISQPPSLIEVLAEIPDLRRRQGTCHSISAILSLACGTMLCGYRRYSVVTAWGRPKHPQDPQRVPVLTLCVPEELLRRLGACNAEVRAT